METPATPPAAPPTPADPREVLQKILDGLGLEATVELHNHDGAVLLHVATPEPGRLIGRRGQTLSQLQFLVNRILLRSSPDAPRVTIDCENYRHRQHDDVAKKAEDAVGQVRRWGEPVVIGPFGPADRRVIQEQFKDDPEVEVVSESPDDAGLKRMTIKLKG